MTVKRNLSLIMLILICTAFFSCVSREVISEQIKAESERGVSFRTLAQETDRYLGKTVILGGYIIETKNIAGEANMTVFQTPLGRGERPDSRARSQGGFILSYKGYLEPEVYEKNRGVTVAGKFLGRSVEETGNCPNPCLKLEYRQIYLWPSWEPPSYFSDREDASDSWFESPGPR
jgi:outer membrane lipoprotein